MSQRVKKPGKVDDVGKRRRRRPTGSDGEEEEATRLGSTSSGVLCPFPLGGMWTPRHLNDLKVSSIYNRNSAEAPAELYRKDLISAMKLADSEPLTPEEYWLITDPWKQEWEKGVQVPVNPESLPEPEVVVISPVNDRSHDFRLPKKKYIRVTHDDFFSPDYHQLVSTAARAEKVCSYDLDDIDASWLSCANSDRGMQTLPFISEFLMEQIIEELELQCWEQVQTILKSQEGLGIEYDENVICDVCRSPESEEGNEMVFCDACNICVHQACYGITTIPSGSWLCRTCTLSIRPSCVLCPNVGGAMKATRSGQKWAHVACAIWIPEVSIGSVEKMEPITKISAIPQSRWSLICVLCKDKVGACIQCSVKTCKTAYHVTCAFKNGLEMKPIIVDENAEDGIKLRSYCQKHSVNTKKDKSANSGSEEDAEKKKIKAMTAEERNQARAEKLQQIEAEFYKYVRLKDVAQNLAVEMDIVMLVYNYWKLKRKSMNNRPLVPPRPETTELLTQQQEQDLEQMKMFVQLRQDLERVRNLCYMVSRREKLSRTYFRLKEQTFQKQVAMLGEKSVDSLTAEEKSAIVGANRGPSIYDQIYSSENPANTVWKDYDTLVTLIAGEGKLEKLVNGVIKPKKAGTTGNAFKKQFVNGARKKNLVGECSSVSESETSVSGAIAKKKLGNTASARKPLSYLFDSDSSAEDASAKPNNKSKKPSKGKPAAAGRGQRTTKKSSSSESDELDPVPKASGKITGKLQAPIYSDSDSDASPKKRPFSPVATKAAVKEFTKKGNKKEVEAPRNAGPQGKKKGPGRKKKGLEPTELIVPQREAAKKATESIRSVKGKKEGLGNGEANQDMVASPVRLTDRESEAFEKTALEKFKDIAAASVQKKRYDKSKAGESKKGANKKISHPELDSKDELDIKFMPDDVREQFEMDGSNDSKGVSGGFVPQRQAAKKAAEHIRSGLSNIVAARLIIEDEMEAVARKKIKGEKVPLPVGGKRPNRARGKSPLVETTAESVLSSPPGETANNKQRARKRTLSKEDRAAAKGGRKEPLAGASADVASSDRHTDWPFLDRGSQSACRRSRERSSSSSSSSSSGSTSSDSSSSSRSSASSSPPASASPESIKIPSRKTPPPPTKSTSNTIPPTTSRGPSRKLKTSDRSPDGGPRNQAVAGKKPTPKSRGPGKFRSGGTPAGSAHANEAKSRLSASRQLFDDKPGTRKSKISTSSRSSDSSSERCSPTPQSTRLPQKNNKLAQEKGQRGKGESPRGREKTKNLPAKFEAIARKSKSPAKSKARAAASAVATASKGGGLNLSSDSDNEDPKLSVSPGKKSPMPSSSRRRRGLSTLSETGGDRIEEKENSCRVSEPTQLHESPSRNRTPKSGVPLTGTSVLSPLTPSSENKEKELASRSSDAEPDSKRPRIEAGGVESNQIPTGPGSGNPLFASLPMGGLLSAKSLFSPRTGHDPDLVDFDSELYDLASRVSADYSQVDEDGGASASSIPFFSQSFLSREDPVEDSPQATLNLVEKLRLQHARKSGCPRSSVDGSDLSLTEEPRKSPVPSVEGGDKLSKSATTTEPPSAHKDEKSPDGKSSGVRPTISPEENKLALGDERWVPPSRHGRGAETSSKAELELELQRSQLLNKPETRSEMGLSVESHKKGKKKDDKTGAELLFAGRRVSQVEDPSMLKSPLRDGGRVGEPLHPLSVSLGSPSSVPTSVSPGVKHPGGGSSSMLYPPHTPFSYPPGAPNTTVPISPNGPRSAFFRGQAPTPVSQHSSTSSLSPGYPRQSFPGSQHFLHGKQISKESAISPSSATQNQRRTSTPFMEDKAITESISSVTSGMPPLSKPSLASPSMLLAANVKNITPAPPPQSAVAQIIENVVNHANNSHLGAHELLNVMLGLAQNSAAIDNKSSLGYNPSEHAPAGCDVLKDEKSPLNSETDLKGSVDISKSPRGRGRRSTTPRASATSRNEKVSSNPDANGVKQPRGRGERKGTGSSPARAKAATPGRGRGRGRGRGKVVATRKDLAGTVYDIDFDEFEENDDKMDLRTLRGRRKSSEPVEIKPGKSEHSHSPSDHPLLSFEITSPKNKDADNTRSLMSHKNNMQTQGANENIVPVLNTPLPGPMDMRTYNSGTAHILEVLGDNRGVKMEGKMSGNLDRVPLLNDVDDLEETFESSKASSIGPMKVHGVFSVLGGSDVGNINNPDPHSTMLSRESTMDAVDDMKNNTDFSRNQLKVKIKGPFLDSNYGTHSLGESSNVSHFSNSLHHPAGPSQIVNVQASNPSNLRRMRKKELLRQYWNQDMNMDGSSCGPSHEAEMSHSSTVHRSVITIPKAVASMAIIPTKDDYREILPDDPMVPTPPGPLTNAKAMATEKRKRNRGIREMAALGLMTSDTPRERRRDRADPPSSSGNFDNEAMGKKRGKTNKRPIRSTFIPPTLVDSDHSISEKKAGNSKASNGTGLPNATSTVVTAVNHPTPKLKIKFGDLSKGMQATTTVTASVSNHVASDTSDKEAPSKKSKGRPPKKRSISELTAANPPSIEELKRESMKYGEQIYKNFAVEERKQVRQPHGTKRHKKHKRKAGAAASGGDSGNKTSEVKIIADGSTKLILRFGKGRPVNPGGSEGDPKVNAKSEGPEHRTAEDDSGFTGSSEGSSGCGNEIPSGPSKDDNVGTAVIKNEPMSSASISANMTSEAPTLSGAPVPNFQDYSNEVAPDMKPLGGNRGFQTDKIMPIRLKLSRCFEGYSLKPKQDNCAPGDNVPPAPANPSDSCEVR